MQMEISYEQQGKWEEAIVTILAHTVHASWTMLAEHERLINAGGGDTGHHGLRPGSPPRLQENGTVHEATWMDKYLKRSNTQGQGSTRKRSRSKRDTSLTEPNRKPSQLHTREDTTPFCSKLVNRTQTLEEEQAYVRQHYGDDFSCAGDTWTERTAMRLCTGHWYNNYNIAAVVESLENTQMADQRYCVTRWELDRWTEGTRIGRRNSIRQSKAVINNFVINHANTHWGLLIAMRTNQTVDILYADSLRWSGQRWIEHYKRWWMQIGRQEQTQIDLVEHEVQLPLQEDTVECGVFVTCYHQAVFELAQEERWRDRDRNSRLEQLKTALEQVTPVVAAQKRRHTRETLHSLGQRLSIQIAAQLDPLLVDLSKAEEEDSSRQQPLSRKRKGVEQAALRSSLDAEDLIGRKRKTERQEGEVRQGRRTYEIVGSLHAGYSLQCRSYRDITGPLTIHDMEDEGTEGQPLPTEEDTNIWEAMGTEADWWEVLNEYTEEKDIEQLARELPNQQSQDGQIQNNAEETKGVTTDRLHETTTEGQATAAQTLETDLGNHKVPTAGIDMKAHKTGTEESKEEVPVRNTGGKRRRSRRTQLADLLAGAELPSNGKRPPNSGGLYSNVRQRRYQSCCEGYQDTSRAPSSTMDSGICAFDDK